MTRHLFADPKDRMQTKLSRICDAIIEAGWLAALVVAPLFFNTFSNRVFEPDKIHLVRSIALLMAAAWLVQLIDAELAGEADQEGLRSRLGGAPLVLPVLILVASYLVSTALSLVPRISFFGSYVRLQGTFTFLSYILIFGAILTHLRTRSQIDRLLHAVIITSLPIAIYGIIQNAGLDPLPWGGDVVERVAANMGNSIFVAAYLIMAVFLTLERLLNSLVELLKSEGSGFGDAIRAGAYLFVLIVQLIAIVYTQSRGPQLGLAAGLYVFLLLGLLLLARWGASQERGPAPLRWLSTHVRGAWSAVIGLTIAGLVFLVVLNIPGGPLKGVCQVRYVSRTCTLFSLSEGTNAVRALIWEGVIDMMSPHTPLQTPDGQPDAFNVLRPLVGYGPESLWVAFNRFYPPELGRFEARNASPDRSHNETFDALARGGLIQFAAEIFLFASVFYYALRWLGLIRDRRSRNQFIAFLVAGGALGVLLPLIFDRSLRLAGIGLPAGLIAGLILYVTVDLLARRRALTEIPQAAGSPQQQLLMLALFSSIVAHFVEVHFGIAIVSTLTHFWALTGVLVAVGMGWVRAESAAPAALEAMTAPARTAPASAVPSAAQKRKGGDGRVRSATQAGDRRPAQGTARPGRKISALPALVPYALIAAIISAIFVWNYTINQSGATGAFGVLWDAFTARKTDFQVVRSSMLLVMVLFTWLIGGITAIGEVRADRAARLSVPAAALLYFGAALVTFLVYGLIHAGSIDLGSRQGLEVFHHLARHIVVFDLVLLLLMLALAASLALARPEPWPQRFARRAAISAGAGIVLAGLALFLIVNLNIRSVQADTYYKQGLGYEAAGQWEGSVILYREAARLQPQEDYYYLFLGRALLQLSDAVQPGAAMLPADLSAVPTGDLLDLVERGIQAGNREDILRAAHAMLTGAQRLNPLNTDHTANLARLHRAWAFAGAATTADSNDPSRLAEILALEPEKVDQAHLLSSLDFYRQALTLSPNNAGLWNELATLQFIQGDLEAARRTLDASLAVDDRFYPTHILLGDVLSAGGDAQGALSAYQAAAQISPRNLAVLSAVGVAGAEAGDPEASIGAFRRIIELETPALAGAQAQLNQLNAAVNAAGGYQNAEGTATSRRMTLEQQVATHRRQLFLAQRNLALVLQELGQIDDALAAAQQALEYASESDLASTESLIASLKEQRP